MAPVTPLVLLDTSSIPLKKEKRIEPSVEIEITFPIFCTTASKTLDFELLKVPAGPT